MKKKIRLVIAVTGASGALYPRILFERLLGLKDQWEEIAVIISDTALSVWKYELPGSSPHDFPFRFYTNSDFFAAPASGSAGFDGMIICPCSAGTLGRIASGTADNLIVRAADVMLKERRKLILLFRESPYSLIHIRNMEILTQAGAIIYPASPGFYTKPAGIEELLSPLVDRMLEQAGFEPLDMYRWRG
jgi:flavin prenyltransferase